MWVPPLSIHPTRDAMFSRFPTPTNHVGQRDVSIGFEHGFDRSVTGKRGTRRFCEWHGTRAGWAAEVPN